RQDGWRLISVGQRPKGGRPESNIRVLYFKKSAAGLSARWRPIRRWIQKNENVQQRGNGNDGRQVHRPRWGLPDHEGQGHGLHQCRDCHQARRYLASPQAAGWRSVIPHAGDSHQGLFSVAQKQECGLKWNRVGNPCPVARVVARSYRASEKTKVAALFGDIAASTLETDSMKKPYKLMVWGPGRMGGLCIWEIANSPALELVGLRVYSDGKNGVDAGELIGIAPMGVKASNDVDALLKVDCDCIVYAAHDNGTYDTDDEILKLLTAGKNIVTMLPYQNAHLFREPE